MRKWIIKTLLGVASYADRNNDGFVEIEVKYEIKTKKITWEVK